VRTNIDIDDDLMRQAIDASNAPTKKAVVEQALRLMISIKAQEGVRKWRGKVSWEGDLAAMRATRFLDEQGHSADLRVKKPSAKRGR
jgi:Arc/MetJ family transcription regulator